MNQTVHKNQGNPIYVFSVSEKIVFSRDGENPLNLGDSYKAKALCEELRPKFPDVTWNFRSLLRGSLGEYNLYILS